MTKIKVVNLKNEAVKDITLASEIFEIEPNTQVIKKSVKLVLDAMRQGTHKTKTRGEVSGTGRKPYRQKGTGNARQGSKRAPHYVGGGSAFALTPRDYTFKINRKEANLALKGALSIKAKEKAIIVIDNLNLESLKTKEALEILKTLKITDKCLFVCSGEAENLYMATRNLEKVEVILVSDINVYDIVNARVLIIDEMGLKILEEALK